MYMYISSFIFESPSVVADIRDDKTRTTGPPGKLLAVIPDASGNKRPYEIYRLSAITLYAEHVPPFLSACPNIIIYNETRIFGGGPEGGGGARHFLFFPHKRRAASDGRARLSSSSLLSCPSPANECNVRDDARPGLQLRRTKDATAMQIVGGGGYLCPWQFRNKTADDLVGVDARPYTGYAVRI